MSVRALIVAVLITLMLGTTACADIRFGARATPSPPTTATPTSAPLPAATTPASRAPIGVAVFGDSNSTGFSGTLEAGIAAGTAWVLQLPAEEFTLVGGWAVDGSTSTAMADAAVAISDADLLIVMAGTNDIAAGVPADITLAEITRIADTVGASSVALCAIAPLDWSPAAAMDLNAALEDHARAQGSAEGYEVAGAHIAAQLTEVPR